MAEADATQNGGRPEPRAVMVELHLFRSEVCDLPARVEAQPNDMVVIRDEDGEDLGRLVGFVDPEEEVRGVVVRRATEDDLKNRDELDVKTKRAIELFRRLKDEYGLRMKVVDAHWRLDRRKVCFYFISEERLDFRTLHKVVSSALNVRVAIKQIGVRDHARIVGGLGVCGRELCCKGFMTEMRPIALRMARQQNLFVEPAKISGLCGKLLCCLSFEEECYRQALAEMPPIGARIRTGRGDGQVTGFDVMSGKVNVRYDDAAEQAVALEDIKCEE